MKKHIAKPSSAKKILRSIGISSKRQKIMEKELFNENKFSKVISAPKSNEEIIKKIIEDAKENSKYHTKIFLSAHDDADAYFNRAILECLEIRKQRKDVYGNSWFNQEDSLESNFWGGVINKTNRLRILHKNRDKENGYESYMDNLKDLVVLTLFTLATAIKEKEK